jgi:hypothetical protein
MLHALLSCLTPKQLTRRRCFHAVAPTVVVGCNPHVLATVISQLLIGTIEFDQDCQVKTLPVDERLYHEFL